MTPTQIIAKFELFMDDTTELSSDEEFDIFLKNYYKVCTEKTWEFLKKERTGVATNVAYVTLPTDFLFLTANANYTNSEELASNPVVYVGTTNRVYKVVSWSDRRAYRDQNNVCWIDYPAGRLVFAAPLTSLETVEFDYHSIPPTPALSDTILIPSVYADIVYHAMCMDDSIIQQSDKAKSYLKENQAMYTSILNRMKMWDSKLVQL